MLLRPANLAITERKEYITLPTSGNSLLPASSFHSQGLLTCTYYIHHLGATTRPNYSISRTEALRYFMTAGRVETMKSLPRGSLAGAYTAVAAVVPPILLALSLHIQN
jgi:hypothetical protein